MNGVMNKSNVKSVLSIYIHHKLVSTIDLSHDEEKDVTIGRAADNDIVIPSSVVSSYHALVRIDDGTCMIQDLDSTNGLLVNEKPITEQKLQNGDNIRIDLINNPQDQGVLMVYSLLEANEDEKWAEFSFQKENTMSIGRDDSNDVVISHSMLSRRHAIIKKEGQTLYIEDLNSTNGTYLNGQLITSKQALKPLDVVIIGHTKIIVQEDKILYNVQSKGLRIDAIQISKSVKAHGNSKGEQKRILDDISVSIKSGELVALIGGSGAGKSTFMDSLNGFRLPTEGAVLVNDDDFYGNYNAYKNILGYVPQQDIVYDTLTVQEMLTYAAKLRMPEDTTEEEIQLRVQQVIADVELEGREGLVIMQLSGGQRKRASIAVELLADPKLFYLDEPTSGLDPGMERNMMKLLRKLSNQGKTIVLITHATANLHLCDKVVILGYGGKLCYFGPPNGALEFFEVEDYADIYDLISKESVKWQEKFRMSKYYSYYNPLSRKKAMITDKKESTQRSSFKQLVILSKRYLKLTLTDRQRLMFLILQAPFIGLILGLVAEKDSFEFYDTSKQVIFTLASSGVWLGLLNSIQEVTKESDIYRRERAVNLKLFPYIMSKFLILGVLSIIQSASLLAVFAAVIELPNENLIGSLHLELFITLLLTTLSSTAFGLVVSSMVSNSDRAMGLAPILLIPQLIFNGLVFEIDKAMDIISSVVVSKWVARALSISFNLNDKPLKIESEAPIPPRELPDYYDHNLLLLCQNWGILFGITIICFVLSIWILKLKDTK